MNIRVKPVWIALALAATGAQAAPDNDWYAGVGGGWAIAHDLGDFGKDASKDATALSLFGGYNFTENLGLSSATCPPVTGTCRATTSAARAPPCR